MARQQCTAYAEELSHVPTLAGGYWQVLRVKGVGHPTEEGWGWQL